VYGRGPDYLIQGGLVFQELTRFYLASWGDWTRRAPPRLLVAIDRDDEEGGPEQRIVLLSSVLPDSANLGYQELRDLIVSRVNGRQIQNLEDVRQAFQQTTAGFHVIEFLAGQETARIVVDAAEAAAAGERLRRAYGVERLDSAAP
jgi:hypothetical protein